jgi:hypothetical protein
MDANSEEDDDIRYKELKEKIDIVKDTVADNIQLVVERGNNIEQIVKDTEDLTASSHSFYRNTKNLKIKLWISRVKYGIFVVIMLLLLAGILVIFVCGFNLNKC